MGRKNPSPSPVSSTPNDERRKRPQAVQAFAGTYLGFLVPGVVMTPTGARSTQNQWRRFAGRYSARPKLAD